MVALCPESTLGLTAGRENLDWGSSPLQQEKEVGGYRQLSKKLRKKT